jgi:glycosyltransferase involved in cell wall biosynthesis
MGEIDDWNFARRELYLSKQGKYSKIRSRVKLHKYAFGGDWGRFLLMRVLMVSKACLVGAYQTKLEEIAKFDDVDLAVVVPPVWQDPAGEVGLERGHTQGYELLVDPIHLNGQFHLHYYPKLEQRIKAFRPDILHMDEEPYNLATWLAVRHAKRLGVKSLFFSWQNIDQKYPFPFSLMERQVLSLVDFAIMGNKDSVDVWRSKGYEGPCRVIPQFGVEPSIFRPTRRKDSGRSFIIGSADRRLVPEKGTDLLLEAVARLPGIWRVHIAGEGPEKASLERLARRLDIYDRVHFDGVIPSDQMTAYLGQLDVLVLASRTLPNWKEQFGRVLIEAMACEVAVVGSNSGEIPNVIGQAGMVFPEDDTQALSHCLVQLMEDEKLRLEMQRRGRERVLERYTQEQVAARSVSVYREMMLQGNGVKSLAHE